MCQDPWNNAFHQAEKNLITERLVVLKISIIIMNFHLIFLDYLSLQSLLTAPPPTYTILAVCGHEH